MVWRSSAGIDKTVHLAVDWDHGESPPHGRLAVCLVSGAAPKALLPSDVNIREKFEMCKQAERHSKIGRGRSVHLRGMAPNHDANLKWQSAEFR
jgi:hypothetical protein